MGNAVCVSEDGKTHLVLERQPYDSDSLFKAALAECGLDCVKWSGREKKKVGKPAKVKAVAPVGEAVVMKGICWRVWGGWLLAGFSWSFFVAYIVLVVIT